MEGASHESTLEKINEAVISTLGDIKKVPRPNDKAALATCLKTLLECRRIEELMITRSTIQQLLLKLKGDDAYESEADLAKRFLDAEDATGTLETDLQEKENGTN